MSVLSQVFAVDVIVGSGVANDPYFQMNGSNLNTMNSYIIPTKNDVDPETYGQDSEWKYKLTRENGSRQLIEDSSAGYKSFHIMSTYPGYIAMRFVFLLLWYFGVKKKETSF